MSLINNFIAVSGSTVIDKNILVNYYTNYKMKFEVFRVKEKYICLINNCY